MAQTLWSSEHLGYVKEHQQEYSSAIKKLVGTAEKLLEEPLLSVMDKAEAPASGDMHDYYSLARYYWPNPDTKDGLPYIRKDGESNPEISKYDRAALEKMSNVVRDLALAWYFTSDTRYSDKAVKQLRAWFLDKKTLMNPHLKYGQVSKGHDNNMGRCFGLLDSYSFVEVLDAVALLEQSPSYTKKDDKGLKAWFTEFLHWYINSDQGKEEFSRKNNHAVAYDVQTAAMATYVGDMDTARKFVETFPERRIYSQVMPDGSQPAELERTLAFGYSQFNIHHMIDMAMIGLRIGVDITGAVSADGRSMYKAVDFLAPYMGKSLEEWPYKQIKAWDSKQQDLCKDMYRIYTYLDPSREDYKAIVEGMYKQKKTDFFHLIY